MNSQQIDLVQQSWKKVAPIADQAAALFYARLFEIDPTIKPLFKSDLKSQGRKLTSMINTAVVNLDNLAGILPAVQDLGRRHVRYGVRRAHYGTVGEALLWTLEQGLGEAFTPATRDAWATAYATLAGAMQAAAGESEAAGTTAEPLAAPS